MGELATVACSFCERRALLRPNGCLPAVPVCDRHKSDGSESRDCARSRRKRAIRAKTYSPKRATKRQREMAALLDATAEQFAPVAHIRLPLTRGECLGGVRPCPFVSCKWHLFLDVHPRTGSLKLNYPDLDPEQLSNSCSLDVADRGGETLEEVGAIMNLTRERIRQLETRAIAKLDARADFHALNDLRVEEYRDFLPRPEPEEPFTETEL